MGKKIHYFWVWFDYGVLLPFLAFMPQKVGRYFASLRGILYYYMKRDWRSFTFGDYELWNRTYKTYKEIKPSLNHTELLKLVRERYMYQSIEEFESALLIQDKYHKISVHYIGLEKVQELIKNNNHVVFTTAHFGSIIGLTLLRVFNIPVLHMSSNVIENAIVHPQITRFYIQKYIAASSYMNGGEILAIEGNAKKFFSFLKKEGSICTIADLPPINPNEIPMWKMFFGKERGFASGIQKFANSANSPIVPFVCYYEKGHYVLKFGEYEKDCYNFLEKEIAERPQMWWASDLLELYSSKDKQ